MTLCIVSWGAPRAIVIDPVFGTLCGASDPRLDGVAIGY